MSYYQSLSTHASYSYFIFTHSKVLAALTEREWKRKINWKSKSNWKVFSMGIDKRELLAIRNLASSFFPCTFLPQHGRNKWMLQFAVSKLTYEKPISNIFDFGFDYHVLWDVQLSLRSTFWWMLNATKEKSEAIWNLTICRIKSNKYQIYAD